MTAAVEWKAARRQWQRRQWIGLALAGLMLLLLFEATDLDRAFSDLFYTPGEGFWAARVRWFEPIMHEGMKRVMLMLAIGTSVALFWMHRRSPQFNVRVLWVGVLALVLVPLSIVFLKWLTHRPCPWSLDIYGSTLPHQSLLEGLFSSRDVLKADAMCFPAGHSSGGFMWLGWAAAFWLARPAWARIFLALGLLSGFVMGLSRVMQGAHFLSHVFWAAWVSWGVCVLLTHAFTMLDSSHNKVST